MLRDYIHKIIWGVFILSSFPVAGQGTLIGMSVQEDIQIENCTAINDEGVQFGPALYKDELVYLARPNRGKVNPTTGKTFYKLFHAALNKSHLPRKGSLFAEELNSSYNEGPVNFTQDDRVIYFTRTLLQGGATKEDADGTVPLGIYSAYRDLYEWRDIESTPFNNRRYSNQHPSLTRDGRRMFFASNRTENGYGGYDIFFSDFDNGSWGPAINMGPEINTEKDELFPFIHPSGRLFFSSNGHGEAMGYDVFMINIGGRKWGELIHLPAPINSTADDMGLVLDNSATIGFMSSNRAGGKGADDIYQLRIDNGIPTLEGSRLTSTGVSIYDATTSQRVEGAEVWLTEADKYGRIAPGQYTFELKNVMGSGGKVVVPKMKPTGQLAGAPAITDRDGTARLELVVGKTYDLRLYKRFYEPLEIRFKFTEEGPSRPLEFTLTPVGCVQLSGRVSDARTAGGVASATLYFQSPDRCINQTMTTQTDMVGHYQICLPIDCNYEVTIESSTGQKSYFKLPKDLLASTGHARKDFELDLSDFMYHKGAQENGALMTLPGLTFVKGEALLEDGATRDLELLAGLMRLRPDLNIMITCHTDGPYSPERLVQLGRMRAENIKRALVNLSIDGKRLRTLALGNSQRRIKCTNCTSVDYKANNYIVAKIINW